MKVYKDLPVIARINNKTYDVANNESFTVKAVNKNSITVTDGENEKPIQVKDFAKLFYPAYCITTHKAQGTTIDKPFTIYEWRLFDKKLKYTALTRSTKKEYLNI